MSPSNESVFLNPFFFGLGVRLVRDASDSESESDTEVSDEEGGGGGFFFLSGSLFGLGLLLRSVMALPMPTPLVVARSVMGR